MANVTPSALSNTYARTPALMQEGFADVLNSRMKDVKRRKWAIPLQWRRYWNEETTNRSSESYSYIASSGIMPKSRDVDAMPLMHPVQAFNNTLTPEEFKLGINISQRLRETDQFGVIDKHFMDLNQSMIRTLEMYGALPFNTTFDATVPWVCADGLRLIDSARNNPVTAVATWSNKETAGTPTQAAIGQMRLNFKQTKNEHGHISPRVMKKVIIPSDLEDTVNPIISSLLKPDSAVNTDNFLTKYGLEVETWDYLDSATAWFGMGAKDEGHELIWLWGVKPDVKPYNTGNPLVLGWYGRMVFVSGANRPFNVRGNSG